MNKHTFIGIGLIVGMLSVPAYVSLAQQGLPADLGREADKAIEEAIPLIEKEAEKTTPQERRFINVILKILKSPFKLLKYLIGFFLIVDDPSKVTRYYGPQVVGVDCTGQNYKVIVWDPPDELPSNFDPRSKVVSVHLDPNLFKTVLVNNQKSGCKWSGNFGENEYAFCETSIPVTSREFVEVNLIGPDGKPGSGMSGPCYKDELPEKPF